MSLRAAMVLPEEVNDLWPRVEPLIERGLRESHKSFSAEDVRLSLLAKARQLWVLLPDIACAWVTQIDVYPLAKVFHIFLIAGKLPADWRQIWFHVKQWGKSQGCQAVELQGRKGWMRVFPDFEVIVHLRQELT